MDVAKWRYFFRGAFSKSIDEILKENNGTKLFGVRPLFTLYLFLMNKNNWCSNSQKMVDSVPTITNKIYSDPGII